jgi:hypothetical protein
MSSFSAAGMHAKPRPVIAHSLEDAPHWTIPGQAARPPPLGDEPSPSPKAVAAQEAKAAAEEAQKNQQLAIAKATKAKATAAAAADAAATAAAAVGKNPGVAQLIGAGQVVDIEPSSKRLKKSDAQTDDKTSQALRKRAGATRGRGTATRRGPKRPKRAPSPTPSTDEDSDDAPAADGEYLVKDIISKRTEDGVVEYKVRWKGYGPADDTWQPVNTLKNVARKVSAFEAKLAAAQRPQTESNSDGESEFEVLAIVDERLDDSSGSTQIEFKVRWKGYGGASPWCLSVSSSVSLSCCILV